MSRLGKVGTAQFLALLCFWMAFLMMAMGFFADAGMDIS
jgi:hypothetical protein